MLPGLKENSYVVGRNVAIEYRFAESRLDWLAELATDLVRRQVAVIVATGGDGAALAAKAATSTIPIVFSVGGDPMAMGLAESLRRPGANATGVSLTSAELEENCLELLRELAPSADVIALLVGDKNQYWNEHLTLVARETGLKVVVSQVPTESDFEAVFASIVRQRAGAVLVAATPFFMRNRHRIVELAARCRLPTMYPWREYCQAGGVMSYGPDLPAAYIEIGRYTGAFSTALHRATCRSSSQPSLNWSLT